MLFTRARKHLIALVALVAFASTQAAVASFGCAALTADPTHGNAAVMPSGEPCDLMGMAPAALTLQHVVPDAGGIAGDASPQLPAIAAPAAAPVLQIAPASTGPAPSFRLASILGPPPFQLTQRLRI